MGHKRSTFKEYQAWQQSQVFYPLPGSAVGLTYTVLALGGEAGELQNELKKCLRDRAGQLDADRANRMISELGDVLWYISAVASELGISLEDVAEQNQRKIEARRNASKNEIS